MPHQFGLKPGFVDFYYMEWAKATFLLRGFIDWLSAIIWNQNSFDQLPTALAVGNMEFVSIIGYSQNIYHSTSQIQISPNQNKKLMALCLIDFG